MTVTRRMRRGTLGRLIVGLTALAVCLALGTATGCSGKDRKKKQPEPEQQPPEVQSTPEKRAGSRPERVGEAKERLARLREARARRQRKTPAEIQALMARMAAAGPAPAAAPMTQGRAFTQHVTPEQQTLLDTASTRFQATSESAAKMALLDELADVPHARVLEVVEKALAADDAEVRRRALEIIEGYAVPEVLPLAKQGLADGDAEVRLAAVNSLAAVTDAGVTALLKDALADPEPAVRQAVFGILESKPADMRLELYRAGIASSFDDVLGDTVAAITFAPSHEAVYVLLEGLKSPSPELQSRVNSALYFLVSEQFSTYDEATRWWEANRKRFTDDLQEKTPAATP